MTRFSKCTPYFQVWPTFQNVTPLIHVWPFFTSVTNISKLEHLFFFKGDPFFPSVTHCSLFSQTFYGFLFSYLTITDVTSYVHHKFPVSFLLYIATKNTCQINQIIAVNSSMNAPISETYSSQKNALRAHVNLCLLSDICAQQYLRCLQCPISRSAISTCIYYPKHFAQ